MRSAAHRVADCITACERINVPPSVLRLLLRLPAHNHPPAPSASLCPSASLHQLFDNTAATSSAGAITGQSGGALHAAEGAPPCHSAKCARLLLETRCGRLQPASPALPASAPVQPCRLASQQQRSTSSCPQPSQRPFQGMTSPCSNTQPSARRQFGSWHELHVRQPHAERSGGRPDRQLRSACSTTRRQQGSGL